LKEAFILFSAALLIFSAELSESFGKEIIKHEAIESEVKNEQIEERGTAANKLGIRIGTGYEMSESEGNYHENFVQLSLGIFYTGNYCDADIYGITPHSRATLLSSTINIKPTAHLGIGGGYLYAYDNLAEDSKDTLNEEYYRGKYHAALFGFNLAVYNLRASLYIGITLRGEISYQDKTNARYKYEIKNYFDLLKTAAMLSVEYRFNDVISVMASYHQIGGEGDIEEGALSDDKYMITRFITLSIGYSLSF
jgi:hypothetical protein